jgi:uncharacterized protein
MSQEFSLLPEQYALLRYPPEAAVPEWALQPDGFASVSRTADELSIVCLAALVPAGARCDGGWCCLKVHGPFAFDQVGILSSFAVPLAQAGVGIFAISTFDTDYILVKERQRDLAIQALVSAGHVIATGD